MRIGILNGGGDCPGLNAVTHGVVGAANRLGWEVVGIREGFEGLFPPGNYIRLDPEETPPIMKLGGTILGTANRGPFSAKTGGGEVRQIPGELIDRLRKGMDRLAIKALVCVGGDGTLTAALQLHHAGIPVVGVPKTIDNDISATAMTFGFDSAVTCVVDALDRLHSTAVSHKRIMVLEVMGRHAGWIAVFGGIGGGANAVLMPEIPFDLKKIADMVRQREARGKHATLIVAAEGAKPKDGDLTFKDTRDGGEFRLGGIGEIVAGRLQEMTGKEARSVTLGHLQRGGSPTSWDRIMATRFGVQAVRLIREEKFGMMVSYQAYHVGEVTIQDAVNELKLVDPESEIVRSARAVGIAFGD